MSQNLKITVSDCQLLSGSHNMVPPEDSKNTIKKVISLNSDELEAKPKIKSDHKALNVKLTKYSSSLKDFDHACNNLKKSFESIKNFQMDIPADNNEQKFEELDTTVKNIIGKQFGIHYPKLTTSLKKNHQQYVSNFEIPNNLIINNYTSGHTQLNLALKEAYEYVSTIFDLNMKYRFWLEMIIRPNEFDDLNDVQEYLIQNKFSKEQLTTKQYDFNSFYSSLHNKLINIINSFGEVHKPQAVNENIVIKEDEFKDNKLEMDLKIKNLIAENEKLKITESEHCKQTQVLLEELEFRNKKLTNAKSCFALLTKEKNDLISIIKKTEVKEEGFYSLQKRLQEEQETNKQLRTLIDEYEKKMSSNSFK